MITVSTFFDESGKFNDHDVISFGGVVSPSVDFHEQGFVNEWARCLDQNGLRVLRANRPLSDKNPALGTENRIAALLPFIQCVRNHIQVVTGIAIDVKAYRAMPPHFIQMMGDNPHFTAFTRALLAVLEITGQEDKISLICDDEEQTAWPMYQMFRRVKLIYPDAHEKLRAITFADDRWSFGLQAADMVVSLVRCDADKQFFGKEYQYAPLFSALSATPAKESEAIGLCAIAFCDSAMLQSIAEKWPKPAAKTLDEVKAAYQKS